MKTYLATVLILNCLLAFTYAVSDENICDTTCQYCCRNKQCQSESTCKGNYQPFIILGAIAGGLIVLFIARRVYVYYRRKNAIAMGRVEEKSKRPSRWRRRKGSKSPAKEKKSKESSSSSKKRKEKSVKSSSVKSLKDADEKKMNMSKGDIYLQIDNESVLSAEDVKSTKNKEKDGDKSLRVTSRNELKPNSKNEILNKSEKDLDNKDRLNPYKQNKIDFPAELQDKENKKGDKRSTSKGKGTSSSKKTDMKGSTKDMKGSTQMKSSVNQGAAKERGRSKEPSSGKERSASQKKPTSSGPKDGKSRGNSSGPRKNQV